MKKDTFKNVFQIVTNFPSSKIQYFFENLIKPLGIADHCFFQSLCIKINNHSQLMKITKNFHQFFFGFLKKKCVKKCVKNVSKMCQKCVKKKVYNFFFFLLLWLRCLVCPFQIGYFLVLSSRSKEFSQ